jgi:hypothetical protein
MSRIRNTDFLLRNKGLNQIPTFFMYPTIIFILLGPEPVQVLNRISTVDSCHILSLCKPQREFGFSLYSRIFVNSFIGDRSLLHLVGACWSSGGGHESLFITKAFCAARKKAHFLLDNFSVELRGGFLCALTPPPPPPPASSLIKDVGCKNTLNAPTYLIIRFPCIEIHFWRLSSSYE